MAKDKDKKEEKTEEKAAAPAAPAAEAAAPAPAEKPAVKKDVFKRDSDTAMDMHITDLGRRVMAMIDAIKTNIAITYMGESDMVDDVLVALLCGGHVLIEGVPGIGKTTLASALSKAINFSFKRIQFTPDTTPSDITGFNMYNPKTQEFQFNEGGVFANIVIADEINRTSPKVQAGLLEAMAEHQVSVDGKIHNLPKPFLVVATQNPSEQFGTYELPEAQLDRFFMKFTVSYLPNELELNLLKLDAKMKAAGKKREKSAITADHIIKLQELVATVKMDEKLYKYVMDIVEATRNHPQVHTGISTRSAIQLVDGSKANALIRGREFVTPDDIRTIIKPIFNHKLVLSDIAKLEGASSIKILEQIVGKIPVPE